MDNIVVIDKRPTVIIGKGPPASAVDLISGPLAGGATGEILRKRSGTDYDFEYVAAPTGVSRFEFTQASPLATWTINHNFGYRPDITLFSAGGIKVDAEILHVTLNQATATFDIPFSGSAICE